MAGDCGSVGKAIPGQVSGSQFRSLGQTGLAMSANPSSPRVRWVRDSSEDEGLASVGVALT